MQCCLDLTHCGLVTPYGVRYLGSTLVQVMACCLTAPSHYLNQSWHIISKVQRHSYEVNFTIYNSAINHWNYLENYLSKISFKSPRGQWVNTNKIFRKHVNTCLSVSGNAFVGYDENAFRHFTYFSNNSHISQRPKFCSYWLKGYSHTANRFKHHKF